MTVGTRVFVKPLQGFMPSRTVVGAQDALPGIPVASFLQLSCGHALTSAEIERWGLRVDSGNRIGCPRCWRLDASSH